MTWGHSYWPWFLVGFLALFLGPEIYALCTNWRNTLSNWIWQALNVQRGQPVTSWTAVHFLVGGALLVVFGWLIGHLLFRIWTG